jgi:hypothetical protein
VVIILSTRAFNEIVSYDAIVSPPSTTAIPKKYANADHTAETEQTERQTEQSSQLLTERESSSRLAESAAAGCAVQVQGAGQFLF